MQKLFRVALYARVSTADQNPETQLVDLRAYVERRDWTIAAEYIDHGISGAREKRPELDRLMADARRRSFDAVLVWRFDRFARSTKHLVTALEEFRHYGIAFVSFSENLDLGSPLGEAMFAIIAALSKLERDVIAERVKSGIRRARAEGKRLGRPKVWVSRSKIAALRAEGRSLRAIARELGVSAATIRRSLEARAAA